MPHAMKEVIGMDALARIAPSWKNPMTWHRANKLKQEVRDGQCTVLLNKHGEALRVVSLTVFEIHHGDRSLVQLAQMDGRTMKACCKLPGSKQAKDETPDDIMERLLSTKLAAFDGLLEIDHTVLEEDRSKSSEYDICTKYLRTVIHANLVALDHLRICCCCERETAVLDRKRSMEP